MDVQCTAAQIRKTNHIVRHVRFYFPHRDSRSICRSLVGCTFDTLGLHCCDLGAEFDTLICNRFEVHIRAVFPLAGFWVHSQCVYHFVCIVSVSMFYSFYVLCCFGDQSVDLAIFRLCQTRITHFEKKTDLRFLAPFGSQFWMQLDISLVFLGRILWDTW